MSWTSGLQLRVLEGPGSGRTIPLDGKRLKIGRAQNASGSPPRDAIWIDDATISRVHAELRWNSWEKTYVVIHRSETNLTRVNGEPTDKYALAVGDRIGMGSGLFELQELQDEAPRPTQPARPRPDKLQCPRDRTTLTPASFKDVLFDSCSYCNGAWLEAGKLAHLHGHPDDLPGAVSVIVIAATLCPACGHTMKKVYLPGSGGVEVCHCPFCLGTWTETDGLKDVLMAVRKARGAALPAVAAPPPTRVIAPPGLRKVQMDAPPILRKVPVNPPPKRERQDPEKVSVIEMVDAMLKEAVVAKASDIHIEGVRDEVRVRYRVDGQLTVAHIWNKSLQAPLTTRLQVMSQLDIAKPWLPQDGHFITEIDGVEHDFRLATVPSERGPACVIRILDANRTIASLDRLGLYHTDLKLVQRALEYQQGFVLTTGPSGSGKTTTLYAMIQALTSRQTKTVTIEDPVEYRLDQAVQVQVNHKVGMDFAKGLRAALGLDPDVILVGEIRDRETAEIAVQASLTGHLLFSTLHTRGTVESIFRLIEMGIEPYLIKEVINCIIAQRLARVLCPACREEYRPPEANIVDFGLDPDAVRDVIFYRPKGCDDCNQLGYRGRTAIAEVLVGSEAIRDAVTNKATVKEIRNIAIQEGMRPLHLNAFEKVREGITSFEEARQIFGSL